MKSSTYGLHVAHCLTHGKHLYASRAKAKQAIRALHDRMRAYPCGVLNGWHIGHLPHVVRNGDTTSSEWYGDAR